MKTLLLLLVSISCLGQDGFIIPPGWIDDGIVTNEWLQEHPIKVTTVSRPPYTGGDALTVGQFNYNGSAVNATVYPSETLSTDYVICYPGSGEAYGPRDGSRLLVASKDGYPRYARSGTKFPFNVVAVQCVATNPSYNLYMEKELFAWLDKIGAKRIVLIGWSLGAREVIDVMLKFQGRQMKNVVGIIAIDGPASGSPDYSAAYDVPSLFVAGTAGAYYYPEKNCGKYMNAITTRVNKNTFRSLDKLTHIQAMESAYNPTDTCGIRVFNWIKERFPKPVIKFAPPRIDSATLWIDTLRLYIQGREEKFLLRRP